MSIQGIDVSHHQGEVDFAAVAKAGFSFAYVKATEGTGYTDPKFRENWRKLRDLEGTIHRGAYHFARPDSVGTEKDGELEARDFALAIRKVGGAGPGMLPPALDFEKYSENTPEQNRPWVAAFVRVMEEEFGRPPVIYTGRNIWRYELGNADDFIDCPLWLVRYSKRGAQGMTAVAERSHQPLRWPRWTFWQWSGGGKFNHHGPVDGVNGDCDVNLFNGTKVELDALAGIKQVLTPSAARELAGISNAIVYLEGVQDFHCTEQKRLGNVLEELRKL
ncbi:MAG: glycoside hydrolase family 25 protein [Myxococcota bacterium]